jgi:hypothetical protein
MRDLNNLELAKVQDAVEAWVSEWVRPDDDHDVEVVSSSQDPGRPMLDLVRELRAEGFRIARIDE